MSPHSVLTVKWYSHKIPSIASKFTAVNEVSKKKVYQYLYEIFLLWKTWKSKFKQTFLFSLRHLYKSLTFQFFQISEPKCCTNQQHTSTESPNLTILSIDFLRGSTNLSWILPGLKKKPKIYNIYNMKSTVQ